VASFEVSPPTTRKTLRAATATWSPLRPTTVPGFSSGSSRRPERLLSSAFSPARRS